MYELVKNDIYGVFNGAPWKANNILSVPDNYQGNVSTRPFIRSTIAFPRSEFSAYGQKCLQGMLICEIYVEGGKGDSDMVRTADTLNSFFQGKTLTNGTQFGTSLLKIVGKDPSSTLYRADYVITFEIYGDL